MAGVKISEMPVAGALTGTEVFEIVQGGQNKKLLVSAVGGSGGGAVDSVNGQTGEVVLGAGDVNAISTTEKGQASGVATLDVSGIVEASQLPNLATARKVTVADEAARLALSLHTDLTIAYQSDDASAWALNADTDPSVVGNWSPLGSASATGVESVNSLTGNVVLDTDDVSEGTVNKYYPSADSTKLAGVETGAQINTVDSVNGYTGVVELSASDVGAVEDAPVDGGAYNRKDGTWVVAEGGSGGTGEGVSLKGDKVVEASGDYDYEITNYSSYSEYLITTSLGSIVVNEDVITLTLTASTPSDEIVLSITKDGVESQFNIEWTNPSSPPSEPGEVLGGGYYAGSTITVDQVEYYLVVAPSAQGGQTASTLAWGVASTFVEGAVSTNNGRSNTAAIVASGGSAASVASGFCDNLTINGYSDWHLPSKDELSICYRYLKPTTESNVTSGSYTASDPTQTSAAIFQSGGGEEFMDSGYWASTQPATSGKGVVHGFDNGTEYDFPASDTANFRARAVRWVQV